MGHGFFSQDYVSAIKLYQSALSRHYFNKDSVVLLYLARAHYDSDNLAESKRTLLKAIHVAPTGTSHNTFTRYRDGITTLCGIQRCSDCQREERCAPFEGREAAGLIMLACCSLSLQTTDCVSISPWSCSRMPAAC